MIRPEANQAYDHFIGRDCLVTLSGTWSPQYASEDQWQVFIRPGNDADLKALIDYADEGGYKLHLPILSQGSFEVWTKEAHARSRG